MPLSPRVSPLIPTLLVSSSSSLSSSRPSPPPSSSSPSIPAPSAPKCIYGHEHLLLPHFAFSSSPDGPFPVDRVSDRPLQLQLPLLPHLLALVISMFVVLALLILVILMILLVYFGRGVFGSKSEVPILNGLQSKTCQTLPEDPESKANSNPVSSEFSDSEDPQDPEETEDNIDEPEKLLMISTAQNGMLELPVPCDSETINLKIDGQRTCQSSPVSTSSCISSEILTDSLLIEEENEEEEIQPSPKEEILTAREASSFILRPSSLPVNFSTSSTSSFSSTSTAPLFNFSRETPNIELPGLMLKEFDALDRSIEKRRIDIRDLLKRIESAKRRHRRFSEQIQRVQLEHNIRF